jgi:hypothetical protein
MRFAQAITSRLILAALAAALTSAPAAWAQAGQGMFVTPVPGAPFVGQVSVQRTILQPDGKTIILYTRHLIARDADGRIRNERTVFLTANSTEAPAVINVHLYDPQNRFSTWLSPIRKTFWIVPVRHPPATDAPAGYASPAGSTQPSSQFANEQDLGTRTIAGLEVHGVRETQRVPASASGTGKDIVLTDEYWYSYDLKMNLSVTHTDPRTGSVTMTVTKLTQTDPDPSLFAIPADYKPFTQPHPRKTNSQ